MINLADNLDFWVTDTWQFLGGRYERSSSYGGQKYDRDNRDRTHSAGDRDGNGGNHGSTTGQQRQVCIYM